MSRDGRPQFVSKTIKGEGVRLEPCPASDCEGMYYAGRQKNQYRRCTRGHRICVRCQSVARRFGRRGLTCNC